jgi:hypothetical protein
LSRHQKMQLILASLVTVICLVAAATYMADGDGLSFVDPADPGRSYLAVIVLVALDAVVPISGARRP